MKGSTSGDIETVITEQAVKERIEKLVAAQAAKERDLATAAWIERPSKYSGIIARSIGQLKHDYPGDTFSGAMYLPYAKGEKSQHCFEGPSGHNVNGADYVIKHTAVPTEVSLLNATLTNYVMPNKDGLLDYVFSGGDDLCKRVKAKLDNKVMGKGLGFAAVACGKKFVWYQLGYKYFAAAAIGGDARAVSSATVDSYNPNCGQIIFFP